MHPTDEVKKKLEGITNRYTAFADRSAECVSLIAHVTEKMKDGKNLTDAEVLGAARAMLTLNRWCMAMHLDCKEGYLFFSGCLLDLSRLDDSDYEFSETMVRNTRRLMALIPEVEDEVMKSFERLEGEG